MNIRETISIRSPNGIEEECAKFTIDDITIPFVFKSVTDINEEYVFSLWLMAEQDSTITVENKEIDLNLEWEQHAVNFTASDSSLKIYFNNIGVYYFYNSKLETGNVSTDWSPSPKDLEALLELKVSKDELISEINASANVIRLKSNRLIVESDNLKIFEDGTIVAKNGEFIGTIKGSSGEFTKAFSVNLGIEDGSTFGMNLTDDEYFIIGYEGHEVEKDAYLEVSPGWYSMYAHNMSFTSHLGMTFEASDEVYVTSPKIALSGMTGSKTKLTINGREYGVNKVLWSGEWYGQATGTVTLTEDVLSQPHGIVVVFSWYDEKAYNANWNSFFIPKQLIKSHGGTGQSFFLTRAGMASAAQKYLYISNTTITGDDKNRDAESGSSITLSQKNFVLRYVYGV